MTALENIDLTCQVANLARDLGSQTGVTNTANRIVELGPKVVDCTVADIVRVRPSGEVVLVASSNRGLSLTTVHIANDALDSVVHQHRTVGAEITSDEVTPDVRAHDQGRSTYSKRVASRTGIRSEIVFPLTVGQTEFGFLRFLSTNSAGYDPAAIQLASAYADHAALAMDRAAVILKAENLEAGLVSNRQIGAATGVLMARHSLTYETAFDLIKYTSHRTDQKLREVADEVLFTGELPDRPTKPARRSGVPKPAAR